MENKQNLYTGRVPAEDCWHSGTQSCKRDLLVWARGGVRARVAFSGLVCFIVPITTGEFDPPPRPPIISPRENRFRSHIRGQWLPNEHHRTIKDA